MKPAKISAAEELQAASRFESLRDLLLGEAFAPFRSAPLAYWALPTDRRLPLAFLGRTLADILQTPYAGLADTPGIGQKKMCSLVKLLSRAANSDPAALRPPRLAVAEPPADPPSPAGNGFDPDAVSEVVWAQWRASVVDHGLGGETLGRLAPSLRGMTRVIWNTALEAYARLTLDEIRRLKTHGQHRVHAILEVFHGLHAMVSGMGRVEHLRARLAPRLIDGVEQWVGRVLQVPGVPGDDEIFEHFVHPLLKQVRIDANRQIALLAENRLGVTGPVTSVRQVARAMGLTRARVYQLLNEINDILAVRWPLGRHQVYELADKFGREAAAASDPPSLEQFRAAVELFYPGSRRGAAGPLERAGGFDGDGEADDDRPGDLDEDRADADALERLAIAES